MHDEDFTNRERERNRAGNKLSKKSHEMHSLSHCNNIEQLETPSQDITCWPCSQEQAFSMFTLDTKMLRHIVYVYYIMFE